jgi:hypothetical protein
VARIRHRRLEICCWLLGPSCLSQKIIKLVPPTRVSRPKRGKSRPKRGKGGIRQCWLLRHLADAPKGLVPLTGRRIAAGDGLTTGRQFGRVPIAWAEVSRALSGSPAKNCASASKFDQTGFCGSYGLSFNPRRKGAIASEGCPLTRRAIPREKWATAELGLSSIALSEARIACSSLFEKLQVMAKA